MELPQIAAVLAVWAKGKPLIRRVFIFGSRVRGDHRLDSDVDIAVELNPDHFRGTDESGGLATWMFETGEWRDELQKLFPFEVQLERYHANQTPTIATGLVRSSMLVYEKQPNSALEMDAVKSVRITALLNANVSRYIHGSLAREA